MKIITRYLGITIITYVSLVTLFLLGLHMFVEFLHEFPSIGEGNYGLLQSVVYVLLMLPADIYQFFPMASLVGSIIALGLLASHSELIVMRLSGMSLLGIAAAVVKAALVLIVIITFIGEVLSPAALSYAAKIKTTAMSGGKILLTHQGMWLYAKQSFTHINSLTNSHELQGITRYQFDPDRKLQTASHAVSGFYNKDKGYWIFNNVLQTGFGTKLITSAKFPEQRWHFVFNPKLIGAMHINTDQKSIFKLYAYVKYRIKSGLDASSYAIAFWQRIFAPFATLVMVLLAIPFVFGIPRSTTMGLRMLLGVITGFGFYIVHQFVGPMSVVFQVPPFLAALLPLLIFTIIGSIILFKVR